MDGDEESGEVVVVDFTFLWTRTSLWGVDGSSTLLTYREFKQKAFESPRGDVLNPF